MDDIKSINSKDIFNDIGDIKIQITNYELKSTIASRPSERSIPTTLIFGSYTFKIDRSFVQNFTKLGLCDIVLINICCQQTYRRFFGLVVHVDDDYPSDVMSVSNVTFANDKDTMNIIEIKSKVVLYTSKICFDAVKQQNKQLESQTIFVRKLSNITSSRRQISAIYNLNQLSKRKSLLQPANTDLYFCHEGISDISTVTPGTFNESQRRVIADAEQMFSNGTRSHLHLVHGPPGFFISFQ